MTKIPNPLKLTNAEQVQLDVIKNKAKTRHEKNRREARRNGRTDFPALPYECSWAFEEDFRRKIRKGE